MGVTAELDRACEAVHKTFLTAHQLTYWQLIVAQVVGTPYFLIFSGARGGADAPDYAIADANTLTGRIEEILASHFKQRSLSLSGSP